MKLRLTIQSGSLAGHQFELEQGTLLLGRAADCTIRFNSATDPGVSSRHAIIQTEADGFHLIDQNSTNGLFVNGQRVQNVVLRLDDIIQLGDGGPQIQAFVEAPGQPERLSEAHTVWAPPSRPGSQAAPPPSPPGQLSGAHTVWAPPSQPGSQVTPPPRPEVQRPSNAWQQMLSDATGYNPEREKHKKGFDKGRLALIVMAVLGILGGLCSPILLLVTGMPIGGLVIGVIVAFIAGPFYLLLWLWLDRYDPEPPWALAGALLWGAGVATFIAFIINSTIGAVLGSTGTQAGQVAMMVFSAPFVEEGGKGLGVVLIMLFLRNEFDGILDGIVYAGVIGLGFATVENVSYYGKASVQGMLPTLIVMRGVFSPFIHAFFTSMTGIGCGISRESHNKVVRIAAPIVGYFGAVMLHMCWNGMATFGGGGPGFIVGYFIFFVPLFIGFLTFLVFMEIRESRLIKKMLEIEVNRGMLTQDQVNVVGNLGKRLAWLGGSISNVKRLQARSQFLRAATKLAYCYYHVERAAAANAGTISQANIPQFRNDMITLKDQI